LESNIKTEKQEVPGTLGGGPTPPAAANSTSSTREASADVVNATKRRSAAVKALTNADERIEDQKHLAETYSKWVDVITARQRTVIHRGLSGAAVIVAILLIGIFFDSWLTGFALIAGAADSARMFRECAACCHSFSA